VQLAAFNFETCALLETGFIRCWGSNSFGQLGYGNILNIGDDETPAWAGNIEIGAKAIQVVVGQPHVCAVLEGGNVRCWGAGQWGALGYGNTKSIGDDEAPASAGDVDVGGKVVRMGAGAPHTCAVLEGGALRCWGSSGSGQLGYPGLKMVGDTGPPSAAGDVDVGGPVVQVGGGRYFTCALLVGGRVRCWGTPALGRLGYGYLGGPIGDDETPASKGDVPVF
jgi:alpha-tubulin suppressor-like RCC1 family protein